MAFWGYLLEVSKGSFMTGLCDALHGLHLGSCVLQCQLAANNGLHFIRSASMYRTLLTDATYLLYIAKTLWADPSHHRRVPFFVCFLKVLVLDLLHQCKTDGGSSPLLLAMFPWNFFGGGGGKRKSTVCKLFSFFFPKVSHPPSCLCLQIWLVWQSLWECSHQNPNKLSHWPRCKILLLIPLIKFPNWFKHKGKQHTEH